MTEQNLGSAPTDNGFETPVQRYHRLRIALHDECLTIADLIRSENEAHVFLDDLDKLCEDLSDGTFKVGLFGVIAAGKSTLVNALLGESILREGLGETTRTLTKVCAPVDTRPHGTVIIRYKTKDTILKELDEHLRASGLGFEEGFEVDLDDPAFRSNLRGKVRRNTAEDTEIDAAYRYIKHLLDGWDECSSKLGSESNMTFEEGDELAHREHVATYIDERVLFHDNPITNAGFVFYDVPGLGSSYARHTDEAVDLARTVDAAVIVTKVDYKFMPPDRMFIRDAFDVQRMRGRHNLVFVLNQIGRINPIQLGKKPDQFQECVQDEIERLRERTEDAGVPAPTVFAVDAACGHWSRKFIEDSADEEVQYHFSHYGFIQCKGDPQCNLKASGLEDLEERLIVHLTSIRYYGFLANKWDRLNKTIQSYRNECDRKIENLDKTVERLETELANHRRAKDRVGDELEEYLTHTFPSKAHAAYKDLGGRIKQTVKDCFKILAERFSRDYDRFERTQEKYLAHVVKHCEPEIRAKIAKVRNEYEARYNVLKEEAINGRIRKIVQRYGPGIDWTLNKTNLDMAMHKRIHGLTGLEMSNWQSFKAFVLSFGSLRKKKHQQLILEYLEEKFWGDYADGFGRDIRNWVERDKVLFGDQVLNNFKKLMNQIEQGLESGLQMVKAKDSERQAAREALQSFVNICDDAQMRLAELEREIEQARPENPSDEQPVDPADSDK